MFEELVKERYSCRNFSNRKVETEDLNKIMEAVRLAPSACNKQPWLFYVVTDEEMRKKILAKSRPTFIEAPVLIVAVGKHEEAWHRPSDGKDHTDVDVSIAVEHLCLAAAELGLGTCWVCSFDTYATVECLNLPVEHEPIAIIPLGYPAENSIVPEKKRKAMDDILRIV